MAKRSVKKKRRLGLPEEVANPSEKLKAMEKSMLEVLTRLQPTYEYIFRIYKCPYDYRESLGEVPPCHICDEHLDPEPDCEDYKNIAVPRKVKDINEIIKVAKVFSSCIKYEPYLVAEGYTPEEELL